MAPVSGHRRDRGKGGGQKGPGKFSGPATAVLIRSPHSSLPLTHSAPTPSPRPIPFPRPPHSLPGPQTHRPLLWRLSSPTPQSSRVMPEVRREIPLPGRSEPNGRSWETKQGMRTKGPRTQGLSGRNPHTGQLTGPTSVVKCSGVP